MQGSAPPSRIATSQTRRPRFGILAVGSVLLLALGCSEFTQQPSAPSDASVAGTQDQVAPPQHEFPGIMRVDMSIRAIGSFRPGQPLNLEVELTGQADITDGNVQVFVLGDHAPAATMDRVRPQAELRDLASVALGSSRSSQATVQVPSAGYYKVIVLAQHSGPSTALSADGRRVPVIDRHVKSLWLLVDDQGGRVTDGHDKTVAEKHSLEFGGYGPFVGESGLAGVSVDADPQNIGGFTVSGTITYFNANAGELQDDPVPGAVVSVYCIAADDSTDHADVSTTANASGQYSYTCPFGYNKSNYEVKFFISTPSYTWVTGQGGGLAGAVGSRNFGGTLNLAVVNDAAAHTFLTLRDVVPRTQTKFGRSLWQMTVWVSETDPNFGIYYDVANERVLINYTRVWTGEDGVFVAAHEYGHAFHYEAIEAPRSYYCSPNGQHGTTTEYTLSCALVEGFADFYAAWLLEDKLTYWDYDLETNPYRVYGDGAIIEATVAAFLYDLVDNNTERDAQNNSVGASEGFDSVAFPGSYIADLIGTCSTKYLSGQGYAWYSAIDGIDEFAYCAERELSSQALTSYFPTRSTYFYDVTEGATEPSGWGMTAIQNLWLYNLYNVTP